MTNNQFEKQIADKLNQFEVQPGENLLDSIMEKRAARRKPFMGLARLFTAAAIITVTISVIYMYQNAGGEAEQQLAVGESVLENNTPAIPSNQEKTNEVKLNPDEGSSAKTPNLSASEEITGNNRHNLSAAHTAKTPKRLNRIKDNQAFTNVSAIREELPPVPSVFAHDRFEGDNGEDIGNRYFNVDAKNRPLIDRMQHKGNSHLYVYQSVSEGILDANSFYYTPMRPLNKFAATYQLDNQDILDNKKVDITGLHKTGSRPLFVDLLYVPMLTSMGASGNPGMETYVNAIKKSSFNSQYGVRVTLPLSGRISVFSGLYYQDQTNVFKGVISKPEQVTHINTVLSYINDPVKGVIQVTTYDTVTSMENKQTAYNYKNSYKLFQLPLGFSYNFGYKKFDFALNTSALINMFSQSKGQSLDMEHNSTKGFASSSKFMGVGAGFSVMTALKVSPRFRLIFEPGLQYFGINAMKAGNNINEKVFNKQLTLGIRYSVF